MRPTVARAKRQAHHTHRKRKYPCKGARSKRAQSVKTKICTKFSTKSFNHRPGKENGNMESPLPVCIVKECWP